MKAGPNHDGSLGWPSSSRIYADEKTDAIPRVARLGRLSVCGSERAAPTAPAPAGVAMRAPGRGRPVKSSFNRVAIFVGVAGSRAAGTLRG